MLLAGGDNGRVGAQGIYSPGASEQTESRASSHSFQVQFSSPQ